jgi:hypothetical protein
MDRLVNLIRQQMLRLSDVFHPPEDSFTLESPQHLKQLNHLLRLSGTPEVSIHFEVLGETPQRTTLRLQSPPQDSFLSNIYPATACIPTFINLAYHILLRDSNNNRYGLGWDISACGIFNETWKRKGKSTMVPLRRDPTIRELLERRLQSTQ